jgi:hypothetical protein
MIWRNPFVALLISTILYLSNAMAKSEELEAKLTEAKLPRAQSDMAVFFDGEDSIYLFGG